MFQTIGDIGIGLLENTATGVMHAGNAFTIEPMINAGKFDDDRWPDDWTAVTVGLAYCSFDKSFLLCGEEFHYSCETISLVTRILD